jgi:hypothetical protein
LQFGYPGGRTGTGREEEVISLFFVFFLVFLLREKKGPYLS